MSKRLMEMVEHLQAAVATQHMPHYFMPDINIFEDKDVEQLQIAVLRIGHFLANPAKIFTAVNNCIVINFEVFE